MPLPPETTVFASPDAVARAAAEKIASLSRRPEAVSIALSGGSTPQRLYEILASPEFAERVVWDAIHWFVGDDRFVPLDHPDSNFGTAQRMLFDRVAAPASQLHPMPTENVPLDDAAAQYETCLRQFHARHGGVGVPLFDLVLLGLGSDGHTASLFPGKAALETRDRWVAPVPEAGLAPFVPRLTLTFPALASSQEALFLVTGAGKRDKVREIAEGVDHPAGRVTSQGGVRWWLDEAAAGQGT